mgnify:CR=1 FL=1
MSNWLDKALDTVSSVAVGYFSADAQKEQAQIQQSIAESTIETNRMNAITANNAKNILLVIGGTIGALLVYKMAVKVLK